MLSQWGEEAYLHKESSIYMDELEEKVGVQHVQTARGEKEDVEHTVTIDNERIQLTLKEFEILRLFLSRPGIAFTRDQLFSDIWGADYVGETRTVDMHIRTLRVKLRDYGTRETISIIPKGFTR